MARQVALEIAEPRRDLGEGDADLRQCAGVVGAAGDGDARTQYASTRLTVRRAGLDGRGPSRMAEWPRASSRGSLAPLPARTIRCMRVSSPTLIGRTDELGR